MRDTRAWVFLLVGILLAILTGGALYQVATQSDAAKAAPAGPTTGVVVAKTDLPARTVLTADSLALQSYPASLVPAGSFTSAADVVGQTTTVPIVRGQPVLRPQLSIAGARQPASQTIDKGKVLVAFPTGDPLTSAGLVGVGDRVDILATVVAGQGEATRVTQTTLQDLEVLEILAPTGERQTARSLVFVVDHQVALVLKYLRDAQAIVDLAIRSRAEAERVRTTSVDLAYLTTTYEMKR